MINFIMGSATAVFFVFSIFVGGWSHEKDLLRHCQEENTMHTWTTDKEIYCEVKNEQTDRTN